MNEIDDILNDAGITEAPSAPSSPNESLDVWSDACIDDILEENGFPRESSEEEEDVHIEPTTDAETVRTTVSESEINAGESPEDSKIPINSPTLLIEESTSRFSGAEWFNEIQKQRIILAGCGGIGSNVAFQLARMAPACITLYDDDVVERVNMAGQLFNYMDIGKAKVNAMADMIAYYTLSRQVLAIQQKFTSSEEAGNIMICGFDNMMAREVFFKSWCKHLKSLPEEERSKCLFIDGRLSMDCLQILCIRGDDSYNINRYEEEFLFSDSEADATVCSMKQTTYLACMIGSLIVNLFTNFVANLLNPVIPYDLPFFTEYDAQNMMFKTEN